MFAKDVMTTNVISVRPQTPVFEIATLLAERGISGVPVIGEDGAIAGMVSEGDLVHELTSGRGPKRSWWLEMIAGRTRAGGQAGAGKTAEDVMSRGVICADYFAPIPTIAALLEKHHIKRVPVVHHAEVVGIVSRANLVQFLASQTPVAEGAIAEQDQQIRDRLMADILKNGCSKMTLLNVLVEGGVVTYWGFVDCEETKETLCAMAANMTGVNAVEANMGISTMLDL